MKRVIIAAVLCAAIFLGGFGCMGEQKKNVNTAALEYMEQKYSEKFEYVAPWGNSMSGTHQLLVSCASLPGEDILVQIDNYKSEEKTFRDNLLAVKYRDETVGFLRECAEKVFSHAKVLYTPTEECQSEFLPASATFREYLSDKRATLMPTIVVRAEDFVSEEQARQLADLVTGSGARYLISLSILSNSEYDSGNWQSLSEFIAQEYRSRGANISNVGSQITIEWVEED